MNDLFFIIIIIFFIFLLRAFHPQDNSLLIDTTSTKGTHASLNISPNKDETTKQHPFHRSRSFVRNATAAPRLETARMSPTLSPLMSSSPIKQSSSPLHNSFL